MKDLGYRTGLAGKEGIKFKNLDYRWDRHIAKTKERVPGANERIHARHTKSSFSAIEKFVTEEPSKPFCLVHAASLPHGPVLNALPNGLSGYDASNFYCDYEFGRDLEILKRHGMDKNTVVVYVNDNEAQIPRSKYTLYETGIHVPMIIRWPEHTQAGTDTEAMVSFLDILPTLIDIAGGFPIESLDGRSFLEVLEGRTNSHHDELYFSYTGVIVAYNRQEVPYPIRAIRTHRYKYIRNLNYKVPHPKIAGKDGADVINPYEELYDIVKDPGESRNLAEVPEFLAVKEELGKKVDVWMKEAGDEGIEGEKKALKYFSPKQQKARSQLPAEQK